MIDKNLTHSEFMSKVQKKRWAKTTRKQRRELSRKMGLIGGKSKWEQMTVKQRHKHIAKMNKARLAKQKYANKNT